MASFRALFLLRNISQSRLVFRDDASAFSYGVVKILRQAIIAFIRPRDIVFCEYERARIFFRLDRYRIRFRVRIDFADLVGRSSKSHYFPRLVITFAFLDSALTAGDQKCLQARLVFDA